MNKKNRRLNHILAFFIPFLTILISFIISGFAPFGDISVLSFEGLYDLIPYYEEFYDKIKSGESFFYSLRSGMGYNFSSIWAFYLSDPTNLIILLFSKRSMFAVLNILYLIKVSLSGLTFSILFTEIEKNKVNSMVNLKPALFGISYALSGYMLGQGLNVTWLSSVCLLPLIILGINKLISEQKPVLFFISMLASFFCNFYVSIMISIFVFLYFISREFDNIRHFLKTFCLYLFTSLLAIGSSMIVILPSVKGSFFPEIINQYFPYRGMLGGFFDSVKMLLPGNLPSVISNNAYGINIYCGTFILLLVVCYIFNPKINTKQKVKNLVLAFALLFSTVFATTNYIFNGFYTSANATSNFGFILVFMFLLIAYDSFGNLKHISGTRLTISAGVLLVLILTSMLFATDYDSVSPFITSLELTLLYYVIVLFYKKDNISRLAFRIATIVIVAFELCVTYVRTNVQLSDNCSAYSYTKTASMNKATDYILANHPNSRVLFYNGSISNTTPITNTLEGYDYILTYGKNDNTDSMLAYIETYRNVNIYKNPYSIQLGVIADNYLKSWNYDNKYPYKSLNDLANLGFFTYSDNNIFVPIEGDLNFNITKDSEVNNLYYFIIESPIDCDLYMNFYNTVHIGNIKAGETVSYPYLFTDEQARELRLTMTYTGFNTDNFKTFYDSLITANVTSKSETSYNATIDSPQNAIFLSNIPYENGWTVEVDGNKVSTYAISNKYLAFDLKEGVHNLVFHYKPYWFIKGIIVSILFLLLSVCVLFTPCKQAIVKLYNKIASVRWINKIVDFLNDNCQYVYFIFLTSSVLLLSHLIKQCMPFGNYMPMGNDAVVQVLPHISNLVNQVRHFTFGTVNWNLGMGIDNLIIFLSGGAFPVNFLMLLFPRDMEIVAFVFTYYVKLVLMGLAFMYYMNHRTSGKTIEKHSPMLLAAGLVYTFNSFVISYFNNITFLDMAIMLPLTILGLEYLITKKDNRLYVVSLFISMFFNVYYAFLLCMFLVIYFFTLSFENVKDFFQKGIRFGLNSILAAGLAAFSLIPFYLSTKLSPYSVSDSIIGKAFNSNIHYELNRLLPIGVPVTVDIDYWKSNIYCGLLVVFLFAAYAVNQKIELSIRIRKIVLSLLLFFAFGNELLNYVFHGFHVQSGVPNRFAIYWIFLILTMFFDTLIHIKDIKPLRVLISGIIGFILLIYGSTYDLSNVFLKLRLTLFIIISVVYISIFVIYFIGKINHKMFQKIIVISLSVEITLAGIFNFFQIGAHDISYSKDEVAAFHEMSNTINFTEDLAFSESIDTEITDLGLMADFYQVDAFSSAFTRTSSSLCRALGISHGQNFSSYGTGNPMFDILMSVRYNILNSYIDTFLGKYETVYSYNNFKVTENPYYIKHGIFMTMEPEDVIDAYNVANSTFDFHNYISQSVAGCNIYEIENVIEETEVKETGNFLYLPEYYNAVLEDESYDKKTNIDVELHLNDLDPNYEYYYSLGGTITYLETNRIENNILYLTYNVEDYRRYQNDEKHVFLAKVLPDGMEQLYNTLKSNESTNFSYTNSKVEFTTNALSDGYIFPGIPYLPGWKAYVDGKETDIVLFAEGAIYIPVAKGTHHIVLKYKTPGVNIGGIISILFIIIFIITNKKKKTSDLKSED